MSGPLPRAPEVLVVGAGPAGSTLAGLLAREGRDVLLVDRASFPRPKPCGECLNPGAVAALARLGLLDRVEALRPARLEGWTVEGRLASASAGFGGTLHGLGVARERLDAALVEAARDRGALLREGVRLEAVEAAGPDGRPRVRLRPRGGPPVVVRPRVVVGADGLRSRVARSLGLAARERGPGRLSLTCRVRGVPPGTWRRADGGGPGGLRGRLSVHGGVTLGLAPVDGPGAVGNATVVTSARRRGRRVAGDARGFVEEVLAARLPGADVEVVDGPWASGPFRQPVRRRWAPGVVLVGDAAGYFDPFTGQGIYRALRSAELAADAVERCLAAPGSWTPLAAFDAAWAAEVAPGRRVQAVVDAVMARAWLREPALGAVAGAGLLRRIIRITGDAAPVSSLIGPPLRLRPRE